MIIKTLVVGALETNCYIFADEITKEALIIDPGSNEIYILEELSKNNFKPKAILLTHGHFDHIGAVEQLKNELHIPVYIHEKEQIIMENSNYNLSSVFSQNKLELKADRLLNETLTFGDIVLKIIFTPGHTPGGVCYYYEKEHILFSGDTLFLNSMGRTDFPYGNYQELVNSIKNKLFLLPNETKVFSGHGDVTTIGKEKKYNLCLKDNFWD